jgi:hypothetical protein
VDQSAGRSARVRARGALATAVGAALAGLADFLRRRGDRWFAVNDSEAYWWGWQVSKALGGLGRRYRDTRFGTLAVCTRCAGAGIWADAPCGPCLGLGRITLGEVS